MGEVTELETPVSLDTRIAKVEQDHQVLAQRVSNLENPPKKQKPVKGPIGVCQLDPSRDSAKCPEGSLYHHQQGCRGTTCHLKQLEYNRGYRERKKAKKDGSSEATTPTDQVEHGTEDQ